MHVIARRARAQTGHQHDTHVHATPPYERACKYTHAHTLPSPPTNTHMCVHGPPRTSNQACSAHACTCRARAQAVRELPHARTRCTHSRARAHSLTHTATHTQPHSHTHTATATRRSPPVIRGREEAGPVRGPLDPLEEVGVGAGGGGGCKCKRRTAAGSDKGNEGRAPAASPSLCHHAPSPPSPGQQGLRENNRGPALLSSLPL